MSIWTPSQKHFAPKSYSKKEEISSFGVRELLNPEIQDELKEQVFNPKLYI